MVLPWLLHSYGVGGSLLLLSLLQLTGAVRLSLVLVKAMYSHGARGGNLLLLKQEASYNSLSRPMNSWLKPYEQSPRQGAGFPDFGRLQRPV